MSKVKPTASAEVLAFPEGQKSERESRRDLGDSSPSVGLCLKNKREALGIAIPEVATETRILQRHLLALENDTDTGLATTFIIGYLRNYASYLGLDGKSLVADFLNAKTGSAAALSPAKLEATKGQSEPFIDTHSNQAHGHDDGKDSLRDAHFLVAGASSANKEKEINIDETVRPWNVKATPSPLSGIQMGSSWSANPHSSGSRFWRVGTVAVLPLICISVVAWAYHTIETQLAQARTDVKVADALSYPDPLGPLAHVVVSYSDPAAYEGPASSFPLTTKEDELKTYLPGGLVTSSERAVALDSYGDNTDEEFSPELSRSMGTQNESLQVWSDSEDQASTDLPKILPDRLEISVLSDSWIDIRDAAGNRLYFDLAQAGRTIDVTGRLPFHLHVGNGPGLQMKLNGSPFAITSFRTDNSARFTLATQ